MKSEIVLKGIVRTPLYPINKVRDMNKESLLKATEDSNFIEAIENSSPQFLREINKVKEDKITGEDKLENFYISLYKYFTRSSTRCTPFGLLGTVGYVELIEDITDKKTVLNSEINKQIRLDPRCFQLIIDYFNSKLRYLISYTINNSIYNLGDSEFRYFERKRTKDDIYYELSKILSNRAKSPDNRAKSPYCFPKILFMFALLIYVTTKNRKGSAATLPFQDVLSQDCMTS